MATAYDLIDEPVIEEAPILTLEAIAQHEGDLTPFLDEQILSTLGSRVVEDYERDDGDRSEWKKIAVEGLKKAAQGEKEIEAGLPNYRRSHVNFPILTVAAMQFHARAYPAICKSGNMVKVKVIGSDKGRPLIGPDGEQAVIGPNGQPVPAQLYMQVAQSAEAEGIQAPPPQPAWQIPPGAKTKRAKRVSEYMNVYLEYRMDGWEADTDRMLMQQPIIGDAFRKCWWENGKENAAYVSALRIILPKGCTDVKNTPRLTEEIPDMYPFQIRRKMATGYYRTVELSPIEDDDEAPRLFLEQHRLMDLDGDGLDEPYIVTVDRETSQVLRVEANFGPEHIRQEGNVTVVDRNQFYVNFPFLPNPEDGPYGIGLAHLLAQIGGIIDTTINQMFDAGHAQIAGGGFIASGLRLQGSGQSNTMRWQLGEYKFVNATGDQLRNAIYERTFPGPSPIMFNLLELVLGAAQDIASIKDVITGDASNQGQVGTTLALIEQGLAVFNDIYKRIYRQLGAEFSLHYTNLAKYGGEEIAQDYDAVLDDPEANFAQDFSEADMDIKPVADPASVTKMQQMARGQFLMQTGAGNPNVDQRKLLKRVWEAADIEDIDELLPEPDPNAPPPPELMAEMELKASETKLNLAQADLAKSQIEQKTVSAEKTEAETDNLRAKTAEIGAEIGIKLGQAEDGAMNGDQERGVSDLEGSPGQ